MRLLVAVAAAALLLVPASSGGGTGGEKTIGLRADLEEMSADGGRIALTTEDSDTGCSYLAVWEPANEKVVHLPPRCKKTSYNYVQLAGGRLGWLDFGGSWASRASRGRPCSRRRSAPTS